MKKTLVTLTSGLFALGAILTLSIKDNKLESLRANAKGEPVGGVKCVATSNVDCLSPSTGQIYCGYKRAQIGGDSSFISDLFK